MRLIALAQQGSLSSQGMPPPPSISALEATRHARLPLPRMGGFPSGGGVGGADGGGGGGGDKSPSVSAAATAISSPLSVAATASPSSVFGITVQATPTAVGTGNGVRMGNNAVWGTTADEPRTESAQQRTLPTHQVVASAPTTPASEDDDFGEFAGCQEEPQQHPTPPTDQSQDDDFGEFSGAPGDAPSTAVASPAPLAAERGASPLAINAPRPAEPSASGAAAAGGDAWMMRDGGGGGFMGSLVDNGKGTEGGAGGGSLDDLIKTNVQAASAGPVHLPDMVSSELSYRSVVYCCATSHLFCRVTGWIPKGFPLFNFSSSGWGPQDMSRCLVVTCCTLQHT